jgi:hypothetical protein
MLTESDLGFQKPKTVEKPQTLRSLEQCEAFGALPLDGGIEDQTHIWLQAVQVCRNARSVYYAVKAANRKMESTGGNDPSDLQSTF